MSVVLSVYNGGAYLAEAVESVLSQRMGDLELVAVDDGSTDGSGEVLEAFAREDRRVHVVRQENRGLTPSLNVGLSLARGAYVARMDADDVSHPERLGRQADVLDLNPSKILVSCACGLVNERGEATRTIDRSPLEKLLAWHLLFYNAVGGHGQVMFRAEDVRAAGGYDEAIRTAQDYDLWGRLIERGSFAILPEVLYSSRIHSGSISHLRAVEQRASSLATSGRLIRRHLGAVLEEAEVAELRRFWTFRSGPDAPSLAEIGALDALLHRLADGYLTHAGEHLRSALQRSVAERYRAWLSVAPVRSLPQAWRILLPLLHTWDPRLLPAAAAGSAHTVIRRALPWT